MINDKVTLFLSKRISYHLEVDVVDGITCSLNGSGHQLLWEKACMCCCARNHNLVASPCPIEPLIDQFIKDRANNNCSICFSVNQKPGSKMDGNNTVVRRISWTSSTAPDIHFKLFFKSHFDVAAVGLLSTAHLLMQRLSWNLLRNGADLMF